jgi:hypothetical protein
MQGHCHRPDFAARRSLGDFYAYQVTPQQASGGPGDLFIYPDRAFTNETGSLGT